MHLEASLMQYVRFSLKK